MAPTQSTCASQYQTDCCLELDFTGVLEDCLAFRLPLTSTEATISACFVAHAVGC